MDLIYVGQGTYLNKKFIVKISESHHLNRRHFEVTMSDGEIVTVFDGKIGYNSISEIIREAFEYESHNDVPEFRTHEDQ